RECQQDGDFSCGLDDIDRWFPMQLHSGTADGAIELSMQTVSLLEQLQRFSPHPGARIAVAHVIRFLCRSLRGSCGRSTEIKGILGSEPLRTWSTPRHAPAMRR